MEELATGGLTRNLARNSTETVQVCPDERTNPISARCWRGATPKHRHLLLDEDIKRWYDNVSRGSKITADVYLRRLGFICSKREVKDPKELIARARREGDGRWAYNFLVDIVTQLEAEGRAGSYIESNLKAVKSWLLHNGIEAKGKIKVKGADDTPTLRDKHALSRSELALFFSSAPPQTRCAAALIAESGLRPESVGNYEGNDGLRLGDLPKMEIVRCDCHHRDYEGNEMTGEQDAVEDDAVTSKGHCKCTVNFKSVPTMITVRQEISKAGHQYFTFLSAEGCRYVGEYLTERMRSGEELSSSSPLVVPGHTRPRKNEFVRTNLLGVLIRKRLRACKISARPYDLRSTFATNLMLAESRGLMIRDYRVFFMGHKGDIEHRYTTNKRVLQREVIEDMRASFSRAQKYVQSEGLVSEESDTRLMMRKELLLAAGFSQEEVERTNVEAMSNDELHDAIKGKLLGIMAKNGSKQKVVAADEVESCIESGWEFVSSLPNGKAVVKVPF